MTVHGHLQVVLGSPPLIVVLTVKNNLDRSELLYMEQINFSTMVRYTYLYVRPNNDQEQVE